MLMKKIFLLSSFAVLGAVGCGNQEVAGPAPQGTLAQVQQGLGSTQIIGVDTAGCSTNVAINNAIGQSFKVPSATVLDKLEIWIKPELYYVTSYNVEIYDGEGTGGTKLATSATLSLNSQSSGTPAAWYSFGFSPLTLAAGHAYTFKLVRLSTYSGAFSQCGNVYGDGIEYWLGSSASSGNDVSFHLFGTPAPTPPLVSVDIAGCNTNVAINNAIGQSFKVPSATITDKLEIWIKPELYYATSYNVEIYDGEGTGGTKLATSATVNLNSQSSGAPAGWYSFAFSPLTLAGSHAYTFKLVRLSTYSGAFSQCGNIYSDGIEYWLGSSASSGNDVSFHLFGTPAPTPPLLSVDIAGCNTNVAINNAIGQSFKVPSATTMNKLEIWIKPELYYVTSYNVEIYDGEGTGGTKLATSTTLSLNSQSSGTPSTWYGFNFSPLSLAAGHAYTFKLVRLSAYSGAFSHCSNVYSDGIEYWLGSSASSGNDVSFHLFGTTP